MNCPGHRLALPQRAKEKSGRGSRRAYHSVGRHRIVTSNSNPHRRDRTPRGYPEQLLIPTLAVGSVGGMIALDSRIRERAQVHIEGNQRDFLEPAT
jgi:hypothetical protein